MLANGNQLADKGTFIKVDGSTAELGEITGELTLPLKNVSDNLM